MKQRATRDLFDYWNRIRGERCAPDRSEIDPAAIRNVLADTFMLDVDVVKGFPFRLVGTRVNALFEKDQKGRAFLEPWRPEERRNVAALLMTVSDGVCPVVVGAVGAPAGQEDCGFELLFLPLRHFGKTHSRILGVIQAATPQAWLGLLPLGPLTLRSLRIVDEPAEAIREPESRIVDPFPIVTPPVAGAASLLIADGILPPGRPHLRVIEGGRAL